ncbi:MAG: LysR family transcriptional regulator [Rhodobacteraceae bacterium]|nr:LysR family transcriptional regulator [Paracoccaceae bacterium]
MLLVKAIAEFGSISQAAQVIGVSQPTASYRLNKLREIFADPVFTRVNRKMAPTVKGQRIIETFLIQIGMLTKLAAPEVFDPKTTERSFTIIAKGFQFSAMMVMLPKQFFKETRWAKLLIEQDKEDMPIGYQRDDAADFLALPYESQGGEGIRRFVSPALQVMLYYDADIRKPPETIKAFSECRFVMLKSLKSLPSFVDDFLRQNGYPARKVVGYAPTSASVAGFIGGTDLVYVGSSFTSTLGDNSLSSAEIPFEMAPIRHEIRWEISKENEPGHAWLRNLLINGMKDAFEPDFQIDPSEEFVLLSGFEQLKNRHRPV